MPSARRPEWYTSIGRRCIGNPPQCSATTRPFIALGLRSPRFDSPSTETAVSCTHASDRGIAPPKPCLPSAERCTGDE